MTCFAQVPLCRGISSAKSFSSFPVGVHQRDLEQFIAFKFLFQSAWALWVENKVAMKLWQQVRNSL